MSTLVTTTDSEKKLAATKPEYPTPKLYLAGPMTGIRHFNYEAFRDVSAILRKMGYLVSNPAEHDVQVGFNPLLWEGDEKHEETGFDLEEAMRWDLDKVRNADAVVVLPSPDAKWESVGLQKELDEAEAYDVPVIYLGNMVYRASNGMGLDRLSWTAASYAPKCQHGISTDFPLPCRACDPTLVYKPFGRQAKTQKWVTGGVVVPPMYKPITPGVAGTGVVTPVWPKPDSGYYVYTQAEVQKIGTDTLKALNKLADERRLESDTYADDLQKSIFNRFTGETRTTSSTGGEKGVKLARYDLIPTDALRQIAEHYGVGANKYDDNQWRKGYEWSKSYAAMQRHANQWWGGEDTDEETGSNHLAAVAWHALTLLTFTDEHPDFDDRYKGDNE